MAKTYGYAIQGFAGGFATGLGLGMENKKIKMLQEEQKRAEKLAKEKEENAMDWLNTNQDSLMNFHTQPQDMRNMLIFESVQYKKEWTDYLRDVEDFLQAGDLESLKNLNNMEEEKIKAERDMLGLGIRPENAFVGKYYDEKDMEYVKKLQMGKLPIKPIGTQMFEQEFGELPPETKEPDLTGAINYLKKFPNPTPEQFNSLRTGAEKYFNVDLSNVTQESLREPEKEIKPETETVTTIKNWEKMFDIKAEEGPRTEEEYNRVLELLKQSEDVYKPRYATWKEALIAEVKGIAKELEGIKNKDDYDLLLNVYMQKLEEIKTKYPDVDFGQFPKFEERTKWQKFWGTGLK